jgi:hypothetical protein
VSAAQLRLTPRTATRPAIPRRTPGTCGTRGTAAPASRAAGSSRTLGARVDAAWKALAMAPVADCPVCGSQMSRGSAGAECGGCGARLS